ncbi:hypothetical protein CW304_32810 [Bacillus sp. UFRGS-B20]|nr:hypothetical protein CW304_32810 [Bacillus sp. UFRGS-B20]
MRFIFRAANLIVAIRCSNLFLPPTPPFSLFSSDSICNRLLSLFIHFVSLINHLRNLVHIGTHLRSSVAISNVLVCLFWLSDSHALVALALRSRHTLFHFSAISVNRSEFRFWREKILICFAQNCFATYSSQRGCHYLEATP